MRKALLISLTLLGSMAAWSVRVPSGLGADGATRYAYKSATQRAQLNNEKKAVLMEKAAGTKGLQKQSASQSSLGKTTDFGYLLGTDGTDWFCVANHTIEKVPVEGGYEGLTKNVITAYEFIIYDSQHKEVGRVHDKVELDESTYETGVADITICTPVSQKFFNYDNKYEVMITVVYNLDLTHNTYPRTHIKTYVYQIGGEKDAEGNDRKILTLNGYLVDAIDAAKDKWAENYYFTFIEEVGDINAATQDEFLASCGYNVTTYSKVGYGDASPVEVNKFFAPELRMPGDQMSAPFLFSFMRNGEPYFVTSLYEDKFYSVQGLMDWETGEYQDPVQNENNNLVVTIYKLASGKWEAVQTTKIPVVKASDVDGEIYTYYSVGNLRYDQDVNFGDYLPDPDQAAITVNRQVYTLADDDNYINSFTVYDNLGEELLPLADKCSGFTLLSDVPGLDPEVLFVYFDGTDYRLSFTDLYTGDEQFHLAQTVNGFNINTNLDRVPSGDSAKYAVSVSTADYDEDQNVIHSILWLDDQGHYIGRDKLNLGKGVHLAQVYMNQAALSPYLYNTDDSREYMVLVKRGNDYNSVLAEEFCVVSAKSGVFFQLGEDAEKGAIMNIANVNLATNPQIAVVYRDDDFKYSIDFYDLPMSVFAGGEGTAENPYQIASAGDLQQMQKFPKANYVLTKDIDASDYYFTPIKDFSGKLDGKGHTVGNLTVKSSGSTAGIFGSMSNAEVRNLDLVNVKFMLSSDCDKAAVVAADMSNSVIDNVHVYNISLSNTDFAGVFGAIAGQASFKSKINNCSGANIEAILPQSSLGGIAADILTGVQITGCSFSGTLTGSSPVGGIAGSSLTGDELIEDCHVDAALTAENVIGGVIGYSNRSTVNRCYVEGTVEATKANRWEDVGPCAGGIVGELEGDFGNTPDGGGERVATQGVVRNNYVALTSLKGFTSQGAGSFAEQRTTMHRIVGRSKINHEADPAIVIEAERSIADNYVVPTLARIDSNVAESATSTEGEAAEASRNFFETTLGFQFGDDKNWSDYSEADPYLNHEQAIFFYPETLNPEEGSTFTAELVIVSRSELNADELIEGFSCESTDEAVAMPTGKFSLEGNRLLIEFECNKIGTAEVTAYLLGSQAKFTVDSKAAGVGTVTDTQAEFGYKNGILSAEGCTIDIYTTAGTRLASAQSQLSTKDLQNGIYIAVATDAKGVRTVKKILVK